MRADSMSSSTARPGPEEPWSLPQIAHELNSRLDGSLRCLRLVERGLADGSDVELPVVRDHARIARNALEDIAELLARMMRPGKAGGRVLWTGRTIGEEVAHLCDALRPAAAAVGVALELEIDPRAAGWPAGPIGTLILNGVRNAVAACTAEGLAARRVEVALHPARGGRDLVVLVSDTGPGVGDDEKAEGHGIGLGVCRRIADELGARLSLTNVPFGAGAVLQVEIPRARLDEVAP